MSEIDQLLDMDQSPDIEGRIQTLPAEAALRTDDGIAPLPHPQCFRMQSGEPGGDTATVMASACKGDTRLYSHAISDPGRCAYALLHALFQQTNRRQK